MLKVTHWGVILSEGEKYKVGIPWIRFLLGRMELFLLPETKGGQLARRD